MVGTAGCRKGSVMKRLRRARKVARGIVSVLVALSMVTSSWGVQALTVFRGAVIAFAEEEQELAATEVVADDALEEDVQLLDEEPDTEVVPAEEAQVEPEAPVEAEEDAVQEAAPSEDAVEEPALEEADDETAAPAAEAEEEPEPAAEAEDVAVELVAQGNESTNGDGQDEDPDEDPQIYLSPNNAPILSNQQDLVLTWSLAPEVDGVAGYFVGGVELGHFHMRNELEGYYEPDFSNDPNAVTVDHANRTITIHGAYLWDAYFKDHQDVPLRVNIWLYNGHNTDGTPIQAHPYNPGAGYYWFREARADYDFEHDRDLLPGWDGSINDRYGVWVQDVDHPYGWDTQYEVIDVEPISGFEHLQELHKDSDGNHSWWYYRAKDAGEVILKVMYRDVYGEEQSYEFTLHIGGDVFSADVYVSEGDRWGLPGESVQLETYGWHWQHGDGEDVYTDTDDIESGLTVQWGIAEGSDYATLDDQGTAATLTFGELPEGEGDHRVTVEATLLYNGEPVAYDSEDLALSNTYSTITPFAADFPFRSPVGATFTVEPRQLVRSVGGADRDITESHNVHFDLRYDHNAVSVEGEGLIYDEEEFGHVWWDGVKEITFTRLREWHTDINVETTWMDDGNEAHAHRDWWFDQQDYDIWFDDAPDRLIVEGADSTATLPLDTRSIEGASGLSIAYTVGTWENDDWSQEFAEGDQYTVDAENNCVILNGQEILDAVGEDEVHVRVVAKLMAGYDQLRETDCWVEVLKSSVEYSFVNDRNLLPGWDGRIDRYQHAWVRDAEHPDGWDTEYEVTNVEVVSGEEHLQEFHVVDNDDGWYYRAKDFGEVELKVTYRDLAGAEQSYTVDLHIVGTTYDIDLSAPDTGDCLLPGSTVEVWAQGWRHTATFVEDDGEGHFEYADTTDNLSYTWEFDEGADFGTLTTDASDPKHVTLHINDVPEGEDSVNGFVCIKVRLGDGDVDDVDAMRWAYRISDDFIEPYPADIDARQPVGSTQDVVLELRHYVYGQDGYTTIDDAEFGFWFDDNCVLITDAAGNQVVNNGSLDEGEDDVMYPAGTFTIKRAGDWGTDIHVRATWTEHGEMRDYHRNWRLDNLDYNLWFDGDHDLAVWAINDGTSYTSLQDASNTVQLSDDLRELDGVTISYVVGTWDDGEYIETFAPQSGLYTVSADGLTITSNAAQMAAQGVRDLRVIARASLNGMTLWESDGDFWFHLREAFEHYDLPADEDILFDWWGRVDRFRDAFVNNPEHPDGDHVKFEVTDVRIVSEDPAAGVDDVISLEKRFADDDPTSEDFWWEYWALGHGSATLEMTYTDVSGQQRTHQFTVNVTTDAYQLDVWYLGPNTVLPGGSVELQAEGMHHREHAMSTQEGLTYVWTLDPEAEGCTLTVDPDDPTHATVTFTETPDDLDGFWREAWVAVHLLDEGEECADRDVNAMCSSQFDAIWPVTIDRMLDVNQAVNITPEVRHYDARFLKQATPHEYEVVEGATFEWGYDSNGAKIEDLGNGAFRLTRLAHWANNVHLRAQWNDDGDERHMDHDYFLGYRDYRMLFDDDQVEVTPAGTVTLTLNLNTAAAVGTADKVVVKVGDGDWHEDTGKFDRNLTETEFRVAVVDDDTLTITVSGPAITKLLASTHAHVRAALDYGDPSDIVTEWADVDVAGEPTIANAEVVLGGAPFVYSGEELKPTVTVFDGLLAEDTDYTVTYENNVNVGTGTVTITGMGAYTGSKAVEFTIAPKPISSATVAAIAAKTYTGSAIKPAVAVTDGETALVEGTDYTVAYKNNTKAGTATVTITGTGNYGGTTSATFKINPKAISKATVAAIANKTYTGSAIKPALTVKDGTRTLKSGTDYKVAYKNNTKVGTATVTITGLGNYKGTKSVTFKIVAASVAKATVSKIANQKYDGKAKTPKPTVKVGTRTLKLNTDYTLTYKNNVKAGTATVTIKGKGNYTGTKSVTFKIVAQKGTWKGSGSKWWYQWSDGSYPKSVFLDISGKTYYFDASGYCVYGWKKIGGKDYYFESSGAMAKSKWVGNYYLGADGAMLVNTVTPDGWQVDKNGKAVKKVA